MEMSIWVNFQLLPYLFHSCQLLTMIFVLSVWFHILLDCSLKWIAGLLLCVVVAVLTVVTCSLL